MHRGRGGCAPVRLLERERSDWELLERRTAPELVTRGCSSISASSRRPSLPSESAAAAPPPSMCPSWGMLPRAGLRPRPCFAPDPSEIRSRGSREGVLHGDDNGRVAVKTAQCRLQ